MLEELLALERCHIDRESVLHIRLEQPLVSFIDLLYGNDFDVSGNVVLTAEIKHLLGFDNSADIRPGKAPTTHDQGEGIDAERSRWRAHDCQVAITAQQVKVGVDVVIGGYSIEDEIEALRVLFHLVRITGNDDLVSP